jgi:protein ImuB
MLGHGAVQCPVVAGGRSPADQVLLVPFSDTGTPLLPADRPWPGRIPAPAPATVYPAPVPARVTDDSGVVVTVTGRAQASALPARLWLWLPADVGGGRSGGGRSGGGWSGGGWSDGGRSGGRSLAVISWAGPWPVTERWWDLASSRRQARFQLVTEDGSAWLAVVQDGHWLIEASYD